jgi:hypothetical protein
MAKANGKSDGAAAPLVIDRAAGTCLCGCGEQTAPKRRYRQGHDARLRGLLGRAHTAGAPVLVNGKRRTARALLVAGGFPMPPAPKARKAKATAAVADEPTGEEAVS